MTRLDIERRQEFPWWLLALAILALLLLALAWFFLARPAELAERDRPAATEEEAGLDLDTVLRDTGLPRQFAYGGLTWQARDVGRYERDGFDLIAVGPEIGGNELYYEQGTPRNPYETLYLRGTMANYRDVYVRYEPVRKQST